MAISKKPKSNQNDIQMIDKELAAQNFIDQSQSTSSIDLKRQNKIPIMLRLEPTLLSKINNLAKKRGISRSSWIHFILSETLEQEEN